ncbi:hypothetical protein BCR33DRAFT_719113 [Rhizoclosmatium globosum]|uniref:Uncharacterized protein n=1 Tax=Rhizoclosmatium globosum TaxID=329046 RepID=A0A1Y2C3Y3_9FUNG|nr:hypothetical protein BCR33DRAFT_719113 [Rhizoclosmatium globosum]|eukprot:ORY41015.1 hypothetical protein BCR33DRAFT_719113 [Rhizoclosmatium globosum]
MEAFSEVLREHSSNRTFFDLQECFFRFTFDSFMRIGFQVGVDAKTICSVSSTLPFMEAFDEIQKSTGRRVLTPL